MADNLGVQAANMVDDKIREYRTLQEELNTHRSDMGTLMAQRNENELVKQVRVVEWGGWFEFRFGWYGPRMSLLLYCCIAFYYDQWLYVRLSLLLSIDSALSDCRNVISVFIKSYRLSHPQSLNQPSLPSPSPNPHDRNWIYAIKKHLMGLTMSYINRLDQYW